MRAIRLENIESPPLLRDIDTPRPERGQITIDVAACGLNFADLLMMKGQYQERPPLPATLGMEISGTVREVGADVRGFHVGQRVAAFTGLGGLAEVAVCPADRCIALPDTLSMTDAAGFLVAYGTSHLALRHRAGLQPDETLVVLGAAGGVGLTAVEIGVRIGARVIAVARGQQKLQVAKDAGAQICLDSDTTDLRKALKELGGVNVVYDAVGEPMATEALRAMRPEGRFLAIGFAGGRVPQFPANILLVKNLTVIGLYWGGYLNFAPETLTGSLAELLDWYVQGHLTPHVSHVLPFEQALDGFEMLRSRKSTGKVVISIRDNA